MGIICPYVVIITNLSPRALEVIPCVLAENAGVEPIAALERLREAQSGDEGGRCGIDGYTGEVGDMGEQMVVEPLPLKQRALASAFQTVAALLSLGGVYVEEQAEKRLRPPGPGGGGG